MHKDYLDLYTELGTTMTLLKTDDNPSNSRSNACWCSQFTTYNESTTACWCQTDDLNGVCTTVPASFDDYFRTVTHAKKFKDLDHLFKDLMMDMETIQQHSAV